MLDPKEGKIRTCILAKRRLSIFLLRNYSNVDNTSVSLELQSGYIRVLSAYLAFEKENFPDGLVRGLAEECEKLKKGLVIGCAPTPITPSGVAQITATEVSLFLILF